MRAVLPDWEVKHVGADATHQLSSSITDAQAAGLLLGQGLGQLMGGCMAGTGGHSAGLS